MFYYSCICLWVNYPCHFNDILSIIDSSSLLFENDSHERDFVERLFLILIVYGDTNSNLVSSSQKLSEFFFFIFPIIVSTNWTNFLFPTNFDSWNVVKTLFQEDYHDTYQLKLHWDGVSLVSLGLPFQCNFSERR